MPESLRFNKRLSDFFLGAGLIFSEENVVNLGNK